MAGPTQDGSGFLPVVIFPGWLLKRVVALFLLGASNFPRVA